MLAPIITQNLEAIAELCRKHHVQQLEVFGSAATGKFTDTSDVDFLVEFPEYFNAPPDNYSDNYQELIDGLEMLTGRKADVVTKKYISNRFFKQIVAQEAVIIYG